MNIIVLGRKAMTNIFQNNCLLLERKIVIFFPNYLLEYFLKKNNPICFEVRSQIILTKLAALISIVNASGSVIRGF